MKVAMLAPTRLECGIADYARALMPHLASATTVELVSLEQLAESDPYDLIPADADLVHLQYEHAFFLQDDDPSGNVSRLFSALRRPALVTLHCLPFDDPRWVRWLGSRRVAYLVHSRFHASALRALEPTVQVRVARFPIDSPSGEVLAPPALREALGLGDACVLSIFGFTKAHKGYETALEALDRLPGDVVLLLAGGPQDEADERTLAGVRRRARELGLEGRLRVSGFIPPGEIGSTLAVSDLVLAPFESMTASASIAAALAHGLPVVASDLPQVRELESDFGCPRTFPAGDAVALAAAVEKLLAEPDSRRELADAAIRAKEASGLADLARACLDEYRRLVDAEPLRRVSR